MQRTFQYSFSFPCTFGVDASVTALLLPLFTCLSMYRYTLRANYRPDPQASPSPGPTPVAPVVVYTLIDGVPQSDVITLQHAEGPRSGDPMDRWRYVRHMCIA